MKKLSHHHDNHNHRHTALRQPLRADTEDDAPLAERMATLVFQIAIILIASWGGEQLFKKLRLPIVLGELVAGIIIGPFLLGAIPLPGFVDGLFSVTGNFPVSYELYGFATVASIVLLFLIGLETDINTFLRFSVAGSLIGTGGLVASFILGDLVTVWFSRFAFWNHLRIFRPHPPSSWGSLSTATSVGISATILSEKRKIDSPEGVTILSAAIIDDVMGIIMLAIIIGVIKSGDIQWGRHREDCRTGNWGLARFYAPGTLLRPEDQRRLKTLQGDQHRRGNEFRAGTATGGNL